MDPLIVDTSVAIVAQDRAEKMFQDETLDIDVPTTLASECKISEYASYTSYTETAGACRRTDDQQGGVFSGVS